ncbi:MAG TPA: hypothetical protein PLG90_07560 [Ignavibacteria bacterium]|nr:hypothetical protein [Ignavibacteria bacterium]
MKSLKGLIFSVILVFITSVGFSQTGGHSQSGSYSQTGSFLQSESYSQSRIFSNDAFRQTLFYRGLSEKDLIFPISFEDPSPTNNFKGIFEPVKAMMKNPLTSEDFINSFSNLDFKDKEDFEKFIEITYSKNPKNIIKKINEETIFQVINEHYAQSVLFKNAFKELFGEKFNFVKSNLTDLFSENDGSNIQDIFEFNKARDESQEKYIKIYEILNDIEINYFINNDVIDYLILMEFIKLDFSKLIKIYNNLDDGLKKKFIIGSTKDDVHKINNDEIIAIIDFGGDDKYEINRNVKYIIDLSGDDIYTSKQDYRIGSGYFESSFIYDKSGDDKYYGLNFSTGAAVGCVAGIIDESGNDFYSAQTFGIGAGFFGIGFIQDYNGNDIYNSINYSQGFGMTKGVGLLIDDKGNDSYLTDSRSLDVTRYSDHYISMNQGFAFGLRPHFAGGIGILMDNSGNDIYNSDIFGQGGAYWYGFGALIDKKGNDKYNGYQYSQGSGVHFAIGVLFDYEGTDFYATSGVSQGCGHDVGFGLLYDESGDDSYSSISLSQGAGNANGIGILFDKKGNDGYLSKDSRNTRGFGDYRRDYGSLGIFTDAEGKDFYSNAGEDSSVLMKSRYGIWTDLFSDIQNQNINQKIFENKYEYPDSNRSYTQEELFIMAKTIDIPYVNFLTYGYNELFKDSIGTAKFVMKYLGSNDHRNNLVLVNLAQKISYSLCIEFTSQLNEYLNKQKQFNQYEVAFMCSLLGIIRRPESKEVLLALTKSNEKRIVSEAVNALGKIDYGDDNNFKSEVNSRLREILINNSENKNLLKNISFAYGNYFDETNFQEITKLIKNDFYGVRFNAMEVLKKYVNGNIEKVIEEINNNENEEYIISSFIFSLSELESDKFLKFISEFNNEKYFVQVMSVIESKLNTEKDEKIIAEIKLIYNTKYKLNSNLKVR